MLFDICHFSSAGQSVWFVISRSSVRFWQVALVLLCVVVICKEESWQSGWMHLSWKQAYLQQGNGGSNPSLSASLSDEIGKHEGPKLPWTETSLWVQVPPEVHIGNIAQLVQSTCLTSKGSQIQILLFPQTGYENPQWLCTDQWRPSVKSDV